MLVIVEVGNDDELEHDFFNTMVHRYDDVMHNSVRYLLRPNHRT